MDKIGFVGIGKMGMPIACNLLKNGYEVTAGDVTGKKNGLNYRELYPRCQNFHSR